MTEKTPKQLETEKLLRQRQRQQKIAQRRARQKAKLQKQHREAPKVSGGTLALPTPTDKPQNIRPKTPRRKAVQPKAVSPAVVPRQDPAEADYTAYIVGGGPSLKGFDWKMLDGKFVVGINRAYEVLPNADIIYFTDEDYYARHIEAMKKHSGRLIKGCVNVNQTYDPRVEKFHLVGPNGLVMTPGCLAHGRNSSYAAINMLAQWGFKTIYLMGVDMKWGEKGKKNTSHWHDGHKRVDGEASYVGFAKNFDQLIPLLKPHKVSVVSVNSSTNLKAFPIETYEEHFGKDCFLP